MMLLSTVVSNANTIFQDHLQGISSDLAHTSTRTQGLTDYNMSLDRHGCKLQLELLAEIYICDLVIQV